MRTNVKRCGGPKLIEGKKDEGEDNWEYDGVILVTSYSGFFFIFFKRYRWRDNYGFKSALKTCMTYFL
jgi:hypothetical protein